jgi:hypothetical protein
MKGIAATLVILSISSSAVAQDAAAPLSQKWRYCVTYTDGELTETSILQTRQRIFSSGTLTESDELDLRKMYFTERLSPLKITTIRLFRADCAVTAKRRIKFPERPMREVIPALLPTDQVRIVTIGWNKDEDASVSTPGNPRRQFIDSQVATAQSSEYFCGWSVKITHGIFNAAWSADVLADGVRFGVRIPSNPNYDGNLRIEFEARFVKDDPPIFDDEVVKCSYVLPGFHGRPDTVWSMTSGDLNAYWGGPYSMTSPPNCRSADGGSYPCSKPPPGTVPDRTCGLNCFRF